MGFGFVCTQDNVTTTLVDCGQHAELIYPGEADSTFMSDPG